MPVITFFDGTKYKYKNSISLINVLKQIKPDLLNTCVGAIANNALIHIETNFSEDVSVKLITPNDVFSLNLIRVSCGHLFGYAVKLLWPEAQLVQLKLNENGFFYDIDINNSLSTIELNLIEKKMNELILEKYNIIYKKLDIQTAKRYFLDSEHKLDLLNNLMMQEKEKIDIYFHKNHPDFFINLVQASNISFCSNFKVYQSSGIHFNKNNSNKILQRINVISWATKEQYESYFHRLDILNKRDHRILSKKLDLYHIQDEAPGMIFWHEKGYAIFNELQQFIREKLNSEEYREVKTPIIIDKKMWEKSGHWKNYSHSMFTTVSEKKDFCIKPMNCPAHIQIFNQGIKSYKDLPIRISEFGHCHRNEFSGGLHGLLRLRSFTQDDGHIFCLKKNVRKEINSCINLILDVYRIFGFKKIHIKFSTRPEKRIGDEKTWNQAEKDLLYVLNASNLEFKIQEGEGAFYGPKIEFVLEDSLSRNWQCGTIQLDFYLPKLLNATYINDQNEKKYPILIHRAILGSIERFIGILIEEYDGFFPTWLAPIQVVIISISENSVEYVKKIYSHLISIGIRVRLDVRNVSIGLKIREHILTRVPYMLICGNKEVKNETISLRILKGININNYDVKKFINNLLSEIKNRSSIKWEV
ncbi:Threonine--tRNA ligase [Buchnera aphidicola (Thelaxes suberi)]|uniref:threonine--tRNA ligase n=1 Tax=Buchnera aphidicola TaxID=9 RepID=UPI0034646704